MRIHARPSRVEQEQRVNHHLRILAANMPVLIQVKDAHKRFGDQVLLDGAELSLVDDVKVGFIGRNGRENLRFYEYSWGGRWKRVMSPIIHRYELATCGSMILFARGVVPLDFLIRDSNQPDWRCGEVAGQFELKGSYLEDRSKNFLGVGRLV